MFRKHAFLWGLVLSVPLAAIVFVIALQVLFPDMERQVQQIELGMTENEVEAILGPPRQTLGAANNVVVRAYPHGFHDPHTIDFNSEGKVISINGSGD